MVIINQRAVRDPNIIAILFWRDTESLNDFVAEPMTVSAPQISLGFNACE